MACLKSPNLQLVRLGKKVMVLPPMLVQVAIFMISSIKPYSRFLERSSSNRVPIFVDLLNDLPEFS